MSSKGIHSLVLGGARSGKSRFAESQALAYQGQHPQSELMYVATAQALDDEMRTRINRHQTDRGAGWQTFEEPVELASALQKLDGSGGHSHERWILVDCLTLWLTNCMLHSDELWQTQKAALLAALPELQANVCFVSNEVGQGVVPDNALARRFIDEAGWLHQALAAQCHRVHFVVAGIAQTIKDDTGQKA